MVRPFEILAMNSPIKGAQEICHAQKKMVFVPSQSLSEKGVNVKLIGTRLEMYPPSVVTKFSAIKRVGPNIIIKSSKRPATPILILLNILIPLSSPVEAEIIKRSEERRVGKENRN